MTLDPRPTDFQPEDVWNHTIAIADPNRICLPSDRPKVLSENPIYRGLFAAYLDQIQKTSLSASGASIKGRIIDMISHLANIPIQPRQIHALNNHISEVNQITFSPDGRTLASASWDKTVKLCDPATGACLHTLSGHTRAVNNIAFSPNGERLASASKDGTVKLWDPATGTCLHTLSGHTRTVNNIAFSPNGERLASASADRTVRLWDPATGECLHTLSGHTHVVNNIAFSPDGRTLASASADRTVKLWDPNIKKSTEEESTEKAYIHTLSGHTSEINNIAFSPDGRRLASASADGTVRLWDPVTGKCLHTLSGHTSEINNIAFSPDGRRLASASKDGTVKLWDPNIKESTEKKSTEEESTEKAYIHTLSGHTHAVNNIAFSPDGRRLASASLDGTVKLWDPATGVCLHTLSGRFERISGGNLGAYLHFFLRPSGHDLMSTFASLKTLMGAFVALQTLKGGVNLGAYLHFFLRPSGHALVMSTFASLKTLMGAFVASETLKGGRVFRVAFSPCSRFLSSTQEQNVRVYELHPMTTRIELVKCALDLLDETANSQYYEGKPHKLLTEELEQQKQRAAKQLQRNVGMATGAIVIGSIAWRLMRSSR